MTDDSFADWAFVLWMDGAAIAGFQEASGVGPHIDVVPYREAGANVRVRHLPGAVNQETVTLNYGVSRSPDLRAWLTSSLSGAVDPRDLTLTITDAEANTPAFKWKLEGAWPARFSAPPAKPGSDEIAIETLVLPCRRLSRI